MSCLCPASGKYLKLVDPHWFPHHSNMINCRFSKMRKETISHIKKTTQVKPTKRIRKKQEIFRLPFLPSLSLSLSLRPSFGTDNTWHLVCATRSKTQRFNSVPCPLPKTSHLLLLLFPLLHAFSLPPPPFWLPLIHPVFSLAASPLSQSCFKTRGFIERKGKRWDQ